MRDLNFDIRGRDRTGPAFDSARRNARGLMGEFDAIGRSMRLMQTAAAGFIAGIGLEGIESFGRAMRQAVTDAADLKDLSVKVSVDTDDLQDLLFGMEQAGVDAATVETALVQWNKRIGEAYTAGGPLLELFKANGVALTDQNGRLRSTVSLLRDMAELIRRAGSEQERQAIAAQAFGRSGADLVLALRDGVAGLDAMLHSGVDKLSREQVERAAEIDDKWNQIEHTLSIKVKGALIDGADALDRWVTSLDATLAWMEKLSGYAQSDLIDWLIKGAPGPGLGLKQGAELLGSLGHGLRQLESAGGDVGQFGARAQSLGTLGTYSAARNAEGLRAQIAALERDKALSGSPGIIQAQIDDLTERLGAMQPSGPSIRGGRRRPIVDRGGLAAGETPTVVPNADAEREAEAARKSAAAEREKAARAAEAEARAYQSVIDSLEMEYRAFGMSETAQRIANEQRRAGVTAASDQGRAIAALVTKIDAETARLQALEQQQRAVNDAVDYFGSTALDGLASLADGAGDAEEALKRLALELARTAAYGVLLGQGPLAGIMGAGDGGLIRQMFGIAAPAAKATPFGTASGFMDMLGGAAAAGGAAPTAGAGAARELLGYLGAGKGAAHVTGMSDGLQGALEKALAGAPDWVRSGTTINSGYRSIERQAELFDAALAKYGSESAARRWVAPPGRSQHNFGNAADLGFGSAGVRDWWHQNAGGYGLDFPLGNEPWHIETAGARKALDGLTTSATQATKGLGELGGGLGQLGSALSGAGGGGAGGIWDWLTSMTASMGTAGAYRYMSGISPAATKFLLGGGIGLFAEGTENAPPGWAWVGEEGPELMKMRGGEIVRSNAASARMMAAMQQPGQPGGALTVHVVSRFDANGNFSSAVEKVVDKRAPGIARQEAGQAVGVYAYQQRQGGARADDHFGQRLKRRARS